MTWCLDNTTLHSGQRQRHTAALNVMVSWHALYGLGRTHRCWVWWTLWYPDPFCCWGALMRHCDLVIARWNIIYCCHLVDKNKTFLPLGCNKPNLGTVVYLHVRNALIQSHSFSWPPVSHISLRLRRWAAARLHQICRFQCFGFHRLAHGEEFNPVGAEAVRVHTRVDDEAPDETASGFVPQSDPSLTLRYVVADVDQLQHQQVEQPSGDDAAVPGTGEAQGRAGQTHRVGLLMTDELTCPKTQS